LLVTRTSNNAYSLKAVNIDFLIQGIENNNLSLSHSYGPIFTAKRTPPRVNTPQAGGGGGGGTRGDNGGATPAARKQAATAAAKAAHPVVRTGLGCAAIIKLVEEHQAKHNGKFPRLSDIRTANNVASTKDMCTEISLKSSNCLM
jgi:hypothetical protein